VKDLLLLLGKRVHELRVAKKWSQEEFADVSGLHRTYIGQIERGEKNISFGNLVKISAVLGVTASELLSALDADYGAAAGAKRTPQSGRKTITADRRRRELLKLLKRFTHQRAAMDRTMTTLEDLMVTGSGTETSSGARSRKRRSGKK
jgi:transcriptional regulator with XRE-family HTH domain